MADITRLSINPADPGYRPELIKGAEIYCDGEKVLRCHTADAELGVAWCYVAGDNGRILHDPDNPDQPLEREVRGKIEIRLRGECGAARPAKVAGQGEGGGKSCRVGGS